MMSEQPYEKWTPAVLEEVLFRQLMKGEDVSALLPPTPAMPSAAFEHDDAVACMFKFVQQGPTVSQVSSKAAGIGFGGGGGYNSQPPTPAKANLPTSMPSTPTSKPPLPTLTKQPPATPPPMQQLPPNTATVAAGAAPKTPKDKRPRPDEAGSASRPGTPAHAKGAAGPRRRKEIAWPAGLPTDNELKPPPVKEGQKPVSVRGLLQPLTEKRIAAQDSVDPDLIFKQPAGDFPLQAVFEAHPSALRKISAVRGLSGDWRNDTFTAEAEAKYKEEMGFTMLGPSQAMVAGGPLGLF